MEKVTIRVTTGHCLGGAGNDILPGQILVAPRDLTIEDAHRKVSIGYAVIIPNAPEPETEPATPDDSTGTEREPETSTVTHRDPQPEHRDPPLVQDSPPPHRAATGKQRGQK